MTLFLCLSGLWHSFERLIGSNLLQGFAFQRGSLSRVATGVVPGTTCGALLHVLTQHQFKHF